MSPIKPILKEIKDLLDQVKDKADPALAKADEEIQQWLREMDTDMKKFWDDRAEDVGDAVEKVTGYDIEPTVDYDDYPEEPAGRNNR